MKFLYDVLGGPAKITEVPILAASTLIPAGAALIRGVTGGTNKGYGIVGVSPFTDFIGVTEEPYKVADTQSVQSTGVTKFRKVCVNPFAVYRAEFSQATGDTLTGATSATTVYSLTSIEDINGGFIYVVSGQAKGQLQYIVSQSSGVLNTLTALSPVVALGDYIIKIFPRFHKLVDLTTDATKIGGTGGSGAAAGSGVMTVLDIYIQADTIPFQKLDPALHSGLTGLDTKNPRFFADIIFTKHVATHQS